MKIGWCIIHETTTIDENCTLCELEREEDSDLIFLTFVNDLEKILDED